MSDRPFGFDTLTIPAVLVSDSDPNAANDAARRVGHDAVRLPAVLVPAGGTPPAGDYVMLGVMTRPLPARRAAAPSGARENSLEAAPLPQTRYRRGPNQPPTPAQGQDPIAVGAKVWSGMIPRHLNVSALGAGTKTASNPAPASRKQPEPDAGKMRSGMSLSDRANRGTQPAQAISQPQSDASEGNPLVSTNTGNSRSPSPHQQMAAIGGAFQNDTPAGEIDLPAYTTGNVNRSLARGLGMSRDELGDAIHALKRATGLGGADNLIFHVPSDDVERNGEIIGILGDE